MTNEAEQAKLKYDCTVCAQLYRNIVTSLWFVAEFAFRMSVECMLCQDFALCKKTNSKSPSPPCSAPRCFPGAFVCLAATQASYTMKDTSLVQRSKCFCCRFFSAQEKPVLQAFTPLVVATAHHPQHQHTHTNQIVSLAPDGQLSVSVAKYFLSNSNWNAAFTLEF